MHQRRRIIFLFGFGIVLPSLLLGYLAFRGIQNDRALVEKERLEATRRASDQVVHAVDAGMTYVERSLSDAAAGVSASSFPGSRAPLEKIAAANPLIEQLFYVQGSLGIQFPVAGLLYVPDGRRDTAASPAGGLSRSTDYQAGQRLEFHDKEYAQALNAYRRALESPFDPSLTGMILNAVARVQKKSGLLKEARSTYERIMRDHGRTVIPGGMPLGPSAALEIGQLSRQLGNIQESLATVLGLYRSLLRREWDVEKAEFEFFIQRARDQIGTLLSTPPAGLDVQAFQAEFRALAEKEAEARKRTERAILFQESASPMLKAEPFGGPETPIPPFARQVLDIGNTSFLVSIERPAERADGEPNGAWGVLIDAERLTEDVLMPAIREHLPSGDTTWIVRGREGGVLRSSEIPAKGPVTLRTDFASNFPDWSLEFHQPPPRLIKAFLLTRRGLYFFVFLLIAGILIFGLVLTTRSVAHELELARMKSDFVSTVSHEFKSPLTSIRQLAEMLQSGRVPSEERRQKYYDVLLEQSERLTLLTDNILSLAKIEEGRAEFAFERTDVSVLLTDVITSFRERVRHEGFDINLGIEGPLPLFSVDRTALSQAVANLVDNAIKYSGASRMIGVSARLEEQSLAIAVRDSGIGIKREDVPRLFERFYRAGDELTRTVKGSGLGLTLVKEIVEAHRGRIQVESEPGKGSTFTIRLPLRHQEGG
jgi:signal transduction histidine kinase